MSILIIAEAGVNHNGCIETAKRMVDAAKSSGADCIKFQTFKTENLVLRTAEKAEYQRNHQYSSHGTKGDVKDDSQYEMLKNLELTDEDFHELQSYCIKQDITFISTPFDFDSIDFLHELGMLLWKIPSGEVTNIPYLIKIGNTGKPIIMSTGMCNICEIETAINILQEYGSSDITLLHCNTEYPTPYKDVNLLAMLTLRDHFSLDVGYSDHTVGYEVPIAAAALGAKVIEKHFTLDRQMVGPDHASSLEPDELREMITAIRNIECAMGTGVKEPSDSEKKNIMVARKSIVARTLIYKGDVFTEENITTKRPGDGISAASWFDVIGERAIRDFAPDEKIEL